MKPLLQTRPPYVAAAVVALALSALGGPMAIAGMALGLAGTAFCVIALWGMIKMLGRSYEDVKQARFATGLLVLAFFAKLPVYMALGMLAQRLGGPAPTCFLLGLALVYCALVGWGLSQG